MANDFLNTNPPQDLSGGEIRRRQMDPMGAMPTPPPSGGEIRKSEQQITNEKGFIIPRESIEDDLPALEYIYNNPEDPQSGKIAKVLGLNKDLIQAYQYIKENPEGEKAAEVREVLYKNIADKMPPVQKQGVSFADRAILKNLLYREPEDQIKYLKQQGYDAKKQFGKLYVRAPGSTRYAVVDPRGLDLQDITDIGGQILAGAGMGIGTGAKALGAIGAPATGGLSALIGSGIGGAVTGGVEGLRQLGGKLVGAREKFDPKKIGTEAAIGAALPLGLKAIGKVGKSIVSPFIGKTARGAGAEAIEGASKRLKIPTTPAQVRDSQQLRNLEGFLQKTPYVGGAKSKKLYSEIGRRLEDLGEEISKKGTPESSYQLGGKIKNFILKDFDDKIKPAEKIYKQIESKLKDAKVVKDKLYATISELSEEVKFDATGSSGKLLSKMKNIIDDIKNVSDLKKFRTSLGKTLDKTASDAQRNIINRMYQPLTEARNDSLIRAASTLPTAQERYLVVNQVKNADEIYRNVMKNTKDIKDLVENTVDDKIVDKLFNVKNIKQVEKLKSEFPKSFELARSRKLADILSKSEIDGKLSIKKLVNNFDKLPEEGKSFIFGRESSSKLSDLKTYLSSLPKDVNPSGTGTYKELGSILNVFGQSGSFGSGIVYDMLTGEGLIGAISNYIRTLSPSAVKGTGYLLQDLIKEQ